MKAPFELFEKAMASTKKTESLDRLRISSQVKEVALLDNNSQTNGSSSPDSLQKDAFGRQEGIKAAPTAITFPSTHNRHDRCWTASGFQRSTETNKHTASVAYRDLSVYGFGTTTDYQKTFANYPLTYLSRLGALFGRVSKSRIDIIQHFEGLVSSGEMLLVLGKPGSGCTTFLKTLAGHTHGLHLDQGSEINYQGRTTGGLNL